MQYRIAVASRDGKAVNERFGGCEKFLIIEVGDKNAAWTFGGTRKVSGTGGEDEKSLDAAADALGDCRLVLVSRIAPRAEAALKRRGIDALEYYGLIGDAMELILEYYK